MRKGPAFGIGASALAALGWGSAGVLASLTTVSGLLLAFWRMWLGAALLMAVLAIRGRRITRRTLRLSAVGGVLLCADMTLFFSAVKLIGVAVPTVIGALQPALVMVLARLLLGDRLRPSNVAWTLVAVLGVVVIALGASGPSDHQRLGDLLAVGSLLAWSAYFIAAKHAQPQIGALDYTAGVTLVAGLVTALPVGIAVVFAHQHLFALQASDWGWIAVLAVIPSGAHLLMNWAHQFIDISIASLIGSANPVMAAALAYVVVGQTLDAVQIAGGLVALAAISVVAARSHG